MARSTGTPKARTLGAALRRAREMAGIGLRELERVTDTVIKSSTWSRVESGERLPKPEQVLLVLDTLNVPDTQRAEILEVMRAEDTGHSWLPIGVPEPRSHLVAMLEFERTAARITEVAMTIIPGLLQTADYARAIIRAEADPQDVDPRVAVRLGRRDVLHRRNPVHMTAVIGEAALVANVGGREVMADQLQHLAAMASKPNVDLRIVPLGAGWHPGLIGPFSLFEFGEHASPIVHLETRWSGLYLHEESDVDSYRDAAERVLVVALSPQLSAEKVTELMQADRMEIT